MAWKSKRKNERKFMSNEPMIKRAEIAYKRQCTRDGTIYNEPCQSSSRVEGNLVILENVNGELARFEIRSNAGETHLRRL